MTVRSLSYRRRQGASLIECLVYIALFAIVLGVMTKIFFQAWDDNKDLSRNADDIAQALHTGEQWRADIRTANGPLVATDNADGKQLLIPSAAGNIIYEWWGDGIYRFGPNASTSTPWLTRVKSSEMRLEKRGSVSAWKWELELKPVRKTALYRPYFTFETVAGGGLK